MALSPLLVPPAGSCERSASRSKLSSAVPSSNATPSDGPSASAGTTSDLAEQMNENERSKYVKGTHSPVLHCQLHVLTFHPRQKARRGNLCQRLSRSLENRSYCSRRHQENKNTKRIYRRNGTRCHPRTQASSRNLALKYNITTRSLLFQRPKPKPRSRIFTSRRSGNAD